MLASSAEGEDITHRRTPASGKVGGSVGGWVSLLLQVDTEDFALSV